MNAPFALFLMVVALYAAFFLAYKLLRWDIGAALGVLTDFVFIGSFTGHLLGGPDWGIVAFFSFIVSAGLLLGADHWRRERGLTWAEPQESPYPKLRMFSGNHEWNTLPVQGVWSERLARWGFPSRNQMLTAKALLYLRTEFAHRSVFKPLPGVQDECLDHQDDE